MTDHESIMQELSDLGQEIGADRPMHAEPIAKELAQVKARHPLEEMRLTFTPMLKQLAATFEAEMATKKFSIPFSLDMAKLVEDSFASQAHAFYSAAYNEARKDERRSVEYKLDAQDAELDRLRARVAELEKALGDAEQCAVLCRKGAAVELNGKQFPLGIMANDPARAQEVTADAIAALIHNLKGPTP